MFGRARCLVRFPPPYPEGPERHLDASRQKLTPHCLAAIFDSQLPSPKLSLKMPPKLPLPHKREHFLLFQNCPRGEGNCAAIERQKLSRGNFCLAASRYLSGPSGPNREHNSSQYRARMVVSYPRDSCEYKKKQKESNHFQGISRSSL